MLQETCVQQLHQKNRTIPQRKRQINFRKMCFTQRNNKNGLSVTQQETTKWSVHFKTMAKHYKGLLLKSHKKIRTVLLTERSEQGTEKKYTKVRQSTQGKRMRQLSRENMRWDSKTSAREIAKTKHKRNSSIDRNFA